MSWIPDLGLLAYSSGAVVILENLGENKKHNLLGHTEEVSCLAMQHDGQVSCMTSRFCQHACIGNVIHYSLFHSKPSLFISVEHFILIYLFHPEMLFYQILASASASNGLVQSKICLWDTSTLTCRASLKHHDHDIVDLAYSRDDRYLVT